MIAIIKYNAGNSRSVQNALSKLGFESIITDDLQKIKQAGRVIFPGVGEAAAAMHYLQQTGLDELIVNLKQPFLGICLGMQLMCRQTEEGKTKCLGIFDAYVKKFPPLKTVPHIGWNSFERMGGVLFEGIKPDDHTYYLHSYYAEISAETSAVCNYIELFSAAMQKNNFYGVQFHPEKSSKTGEGVLSNFLKVK